MAIPNVAMSDDECRGTSTTSKQRSTATYMCPMAVAIDSIAASCNKVRAKDGPAAELRVVAINPRVHDVHFHTLPTADGVVVVVLAVQWQRLLVDAVQTPCGVALHRQRSRR
jgi:hypothetical protein